MLLLSWFLSKCTDMVFLLGIASSEREILGEYIGEYPHGSLSPFKLAPAS